MLSFFSCICCLPLFDVTDNTVMNMFLHFVSFAHVYVARLLWVEACMVGEEPEVTLTDHMREKCVFESGQKKGVALIFMFESQEEWSILFTVYSSFVILTCFCPCAFVLGSKGAARISLWLTFTPFISCKYLLSSNFLCTVLSVSYYFLQHQHFEKSHFLLRLGFGGFVCLFFDNLIGRFTLISPNCCSSNVMPSCFLHNIFLSILTL